MSRAAVAATGRSKRALLDRLPVLFDVDDMPRRRETTDQQSGEQEKNPGEPSASEPSG